MSQPTPPDPRRLLWFALIWLASLGVMVAVAFLIRTVMLGL
ncbi:MAG TPA: DUF2474 domain-containing protein [Alphaproteobacteria bacterium]|nr:DUF2474 domain-containing protein [Alphaproteobacteria bacterium]